MLYNILMGSRIRSNNILKEIKQISTRKPKSLTDAVRLEDQTMQLVNDYNISSSVSIVPVLVLFTSFTFAVLAWRPLVLASFVLSDLVITRLRIHVRDSFS